MSQNILKLKMHFIHLFLIMTLLWSESAISEVQPKSGAQQITVTEIIYQQEEPGLEPYKSRILLGDRQLRLDDGNDRGDFVLFDLNSHEIHGFNHEDQSHLIMKPLPFSEIDFNLEFTVEKKILLDAPKIQGITPVEYSYFADHKLCKQSVNVKGFLPAVRRALLDYEQTIVEQNKQTLSGIPASIRSSCYMANNYLHASDYLLEGFPLFVKDDQGREKKLLSFQQLTKPAEIMQQPENYEIYYPNSANLNN